MPVADEVLGHRPNPRHPEHDSNGFRNTKIPSQVDIVALGDSQTYGHRVKPEHAWPQQLQKATGTNVYNMGYGGYGPVYSLVLLEEALELEPGMVLEAFYSGNDLYDSFNIAYYLNELDSLKTHDEQLALAIEEREAAKSLRRMVWEVSKYQKVSASQLKAKS